MAEDIKQEDHQVYSNLRDLCKHNDNFDIIIQVMESHFPDLFQLKILDNSVLSDRNSKEYSEYYLRLFKNCMGKLKGLYTEEEVVAKLCQLLNKDPSINFFSQQTLYVPANKKGKSKQLGFIEKLTMGDLSAAEPLTYVDMARFIGYLHTDLRAQQGKQKYGYLKSNFLVCHVNHLKYFSASHQNSIAIVNFNLNVKGTPKWGIVKMVGPNGQALLPLEVYCEAPLKEVEKTALNAALNLQLPQESYIGGNAECSASTGYTALAWLNEHTVQSANMRLDSDFPDLVCGFVFFHLELVKNENKFFTPLYKKHLDAFLEECSPAEKIPGGSIDYRLTDAFALSDGGISKALVTTGQDQTFNYTSLREKYREYYRSCLPGLDTVLVEIEILKIEEDKQSVKLDIPLLVPISKLEESYKKVAASRGINSKLIGNVYKRQSNHKDSQQENMVIAMVLSTLRMRAKKQNLAITLPKEFTLHSAEEALILKLLANNAFVCTLDIPNTHPQLTPISQQLLPNFARNRWLHHSGYRPPMTDNYWLRAAKYWAAYLSDHKDVLLPLPKHQLFHDCVRDMGLQGLNSLLALLADENGYGAFFDNLFPLSSQAAFFLDCSLTEASQCVQKLTSHIQNGKRFPFTTLGIHLKPGFNQEYISLFSAINQKHGRIQTVTLTIDSLSDLQSFLDELAEKAKNEEWTSLIVISVLEEQAQLAIEGHQPLKNSYTFLNDIILRNRRLAAESGFVKVVTESSNFDCSKIENHAPLNEEVKAEQPVVLEEKHDDQLQHLSGQTWPLKRGGAVQLQLQQQQQIEQQRQVEVQQEKLKVRGVETPLIGELLSYENIDRILGKALESADEKITDEKESRPLKQFFQECISANPSVNAPHVIKYMTQNAAKRLWDKRKRVPTLGLNPDNLPKGFYTQRIADGSLVLCYDPEVGYVRGEPTPFTLNLTNEPLKASPWEGDFRQFDLERYMSGTKKLDQADLPYITLFAMMQPPAEYQKEIDAFFEKFSASVPNLDEELKQSVRDNWIIFKQCWEYAGQEGIQFFQEHFFKANYRLPPQEAYTLLFKNQSDTLSQWTKNNLTLDNAQLRALGQLYYQYGNQSASLFLSKLQQIQLTLGQPFFNILKNTIFNSTQSCVDFFSEPWFKAMDDMQRKLQGSENNRKKLAWLSVIEKHFAAGWDKIEDLWRAFESFTEKLSDMGISLEGNEFNDIPAENMLVYMDRVLSCLIHIPHPDQKILFLRTLNQMDLKHGGVPYAITKESFRFFDKDLELTNFNDGAPTYTANIQELYDWPAEKVSLNIKRVLAANVGFNRGDYEKLSDIFSAADKDAKDNLVWLLTTQYDDLVAALTALNDMDIEVKAITAEHLHHAHYSLRCNTSISFVAIQSFIQSLRADGDVPALLKSYLDRFPRGTFLEAVSILHASDNCNAFPALCKLAGLPIPIDAGEGVLHGQAIKLSALLGGCEEKNFEQFKLTVGNNLKPIVRRELDILIRQSFSVSYDLSKKNGVNFSQSKYWNTFLSCIESMEANPSQASAQRIKFLNQLSEAGWAFKYSTAGAYRALEEREKPPTLGFFVDHEDRLWRFFKQHIAIPTEGVTAEAALQPLIRFFKRLQLNPTYLNEIEPLLSSLEKVSAGNYWTSEYFSQLLNALQPKDEKSAFPITVLKSLLNEPAIQPQNINEIQEVFSPVLEKALQDILAKKTYTRVEQASLCKLLLREFSSANSIDLTMRIVETLSAENCKDARKYALEALVKCVAVSDMRTTFGRIESLLEHDSDIKVVKTHWAKTSAYWLKAVTKNSREAELMSLLQSQEQDKKKALILHIVAWSTLRPGLKNTEAYEDQLSRKGKKLVERLFTLSQQKLISLANCYPAQPAPDAHDILHFIKRDAARVQDDVEEKKDEEVSAADQARWDNILTDFSRHPYAEPRKDHSALSITREADLARMLKDTRLTIDGKTIPLNPQQAMDLTLTFAYLKQLEDGLVLVNGQKISEMDQPTLLRTLKQLCSQLDTYPNDYLLRTRVWALLFKAMGDTTKKYPHLAQQFSILCNDKVVKGKSRMLKLATGEGKSHYVAMRAALHALSGKKTGVGTAKDSLAIRDVEDYQDFYQYLGLKAAYIHPKSSREEFINAHIHYGTLGGLSLFLDEQSYQGNPINIDPNNWVILLDEVDFILYEEGLHTSYNYARSTGKTPKEMMWFYQAANAFYLQQKETFDKDDPRITVNHLRSLYEILTDAAGVHETRQAFVKTLLRDPVTLIRWIQTAGETQVLEERIHFTVREEAVEVGEETYPMREMIPLSSDNQPMLGSTFSLGVHQFLATRLNTEARQKGLAQNYHVRPESKIISSQIPQTLISSLCDTWEGFSGTASPLQIHQLGAEFGTQVLHVPTNQKDLRQWHEPVFAENYEERLREMVQDLKRCLSENKSILFAAKNDKAVDELQNYLRENLSEDEFKKLIFYTNDDPRTAVQVLQDKKDKEKWQEGEKTTPVCLVASGFGRGDNVEVDAVFLFDVIDINDLIQKGGRGARYGKFGEVYQYYLKEQVGAERAALWKAKQRLLEKYADLPEEKDPKNIFNHMLALREEVRDLQNRANMVYRQRRAEYTSWCMTFFATLKDKTGRDGLTHRLSADVEQIEKHWLHIACDENLSLTDKLNAQEKFIQEISNSFRSKHEKGSSNIKHFEFTERKEIPEWDSSSHNGVEDVFHADVGKICRLLIRLSDILLDQEKIEKVITQCQQLLLCEDKSWLAEFLVRAESKTSSQALLNELALVFEQQQAASEKQNALRENLPALLSVERLLDELNIDTRANFISCLRENSPHVQNQILSYLMKPAGLFTTEERVRALLPVLPWLKRISEVENGTVLVQEYLEHLNELIGIDSNIFTKMTPLSYPDFMVLCKLSKRYWPEGIETLQQALPAQAFHQLSTWENWAHTLKDNHKKTAFLKHFCEVRRQLYAAGHGKVFDALVKATNTWWGENNAVHRDNLVLLWQYLAECKDGLSQHVPLISLCMRQPGKSWLSILSACFQLPQGLLLQHASGITGLLSTPFSDLKSNQPGDKLKKRSVVDMIQSLAGRKQSVNTAYLQQLLVLNIRNSEMRDILLNYPVPHEVDADLSVIQVEILRLISSYRLHEQLSPQEMQAWVDQLMRASSALAQQNKGRQAGQPVLATWRDVLVSCDAYLTKKRDDQSIKQKMLEFTQLLSAASPFQGKQPIASDYLTSLFGISAIDPKMAQVLLDYVVPEGLEKDPFIIQQEILNFISRHQLYAQLNPQEMQVWIEQLMRTSSVLPQQNKDRQADQPVLATWRDVLVSCDAYLTKKRDDQSIKQKVLEFTQLLSAASPFQGKQAITVDYMRNLFESSNISDPKMIQVLLDYVVPEGLEKDPSLIQREILNFISRHQLHERLTPEQMQIWIEQLMRTSSILMERNKQYPQDNWLRLATWRDVLSGCETYLAVGPRLANEERPVSERIAQFSQFLSHVLPLESPASKQPVRAAYIRELFRELNAYPGIVKVLLNYVVPENCSMGKLDQIHGHNIAILDFVRERRLYETLAPEKRKALYEVLTADQLKVWIEQLLNTSSELVKRDEESPSERKRDGNLAEICRGLLDSCHVYLNNRSARENPNPRAASVTLIQFNQLLSKITKRKQFISPAHITGVFNLDTRRVDTPITTSLLTHSLPPYVTERRTVEKIDNMLLNFVIRHQLASQLQSETGIHKWLFTEGGLLESVSRLAGRGYRLNRQGKMFHSLGYDSVLQTVLQSCTTYLDRNARVQPDIYKGCIDYQALLTDIVNNNDINRFDLSDFEGRGENFIEEQEIERRICVILDTYLNFDQTKDNSSRRILFMQLLHQGVFGWPQEKQGRMIEQAYKRYTAQYKQVLHSSKGVLTNEQQTQALKLSNELKAIKGIVVAEEKAQPSFWRRPWGQNRNNRRGYLFDASQNPDAHQALKNDLKKILNGYTTGWGWYVSEERRREAKELAEDLELLPEETEIYAEALSKIHEARLEIINLDSTESARRREQRRYKELHSSGGSRYLDTLQKLHDVTISRWTQDEKALPAFFDYVEQSKAGFIALGRQFMGLMPAREELVQVGFFSRRYETPALNVEQAWNAFQGGSSSDNLQNFLSTLEANKEYLPRDLRVPIGVLLQQGKALTDYLKHEENVRGPRPQQADGDVRAAVRI